MAKIEKLYFGKDDAESDIARGGLLKQGFLKTRAFEEALEGRKSLIIGRKGSGKSAICLMLNEALSGGGLSSLITPDEISADEIRRFTLHGIPPEQSKFLLWRYLFAVQVAKYLVSAAKRRTADIETMSAHISPLRKFLVDNGEVETLTFSERFWKIIERLKGSVSLEAFGVKLGAEASSKSEPAPGLRANDQIDLIEKRLVDAYSALTLDGEAFHLLIDQVEKVWSNDRESDAMVVGLLLAAKHVKQRFSGWVLCTLFLRTDIYEKLQFADRDKFRGEEFHIEWDSNRILELVLARAQASAGSELDNEELWRRTFPEDIDDRPCDQFIVSRTLMRPRDVIQLCNACRDTAKANGHANISAEDVNQATALYSNWKLSDLQNEWNVNYPFLPDIFVLLANGTYCVRRAVFEGRLKLVASDLVTRYPGLGALLSSDAILSVLYSIGLLGVIRGGRTRYYFEDKLEPKIQPADSEFVIHPAFRSALQSTSALNVAPFRRPSEDQVIQARVTREFYHGSFETIRAPRLYRALQYSDDRLSLLAGLMEKEPLPDEIREEVRGSLAAMREEIRNAAAQPDELQIRDTLNQVHRHLIRLRSSLIEQRWLREKSESLYTVDEAIDEMARFLYRGELGEFRARS